MVSLFLDSASANSLCCPGTCEAVMRTWYQAAIKARHLNRWAISFTRLDWLLIAATAAVLSDLTSNVLPRK